jgi:prophage antirepressor-like protein
MDQFLLVLSYETDQGKNKIKTINKDSDVLFSLSDVVSVLMAENRKSSTSDINVGFDGFYKAQIEALEPDEQQIIYKEESLNKPNHELYVTQPGLLRILSRDKSPACKRFQRWVFHDVIPSIIRHGIYPPPIEQESDIKRLTKLFLSEIEARERHEAETKQKFIETDSKLSVLSEEIKALKSYPFDNGNHDYINIEEVYSELPYKDKYYLFSKCMKYCIGEQISMKKIINAKTEIDKLIPRAVVELNLKQCINTTPVLPDECSH